MYVKSTSIRASLIGLFLLAGACVALAPDTCQIDAHCSITHYCDSGLNSCVLCDEAAITDKRCITIESPVLRRALKHSHEGTEPSTKFQNSRGALVPCDDTSAGGMAGCATCTYSAYYDYFRCYTAKSGYFVNGRSTYSCSDPKYGQVGCAECSITVSGGYYSVVCSKAQPEYFLFQDRVVACNDTIQGGLPNCKKCTLLPSASALASDTPSSQYRVYGVAVACTDSEYRGNFINSAGQLVSCRNSQQGGVVGCIKCTQSAPGASPTCTDAADGYYMDNGAVQTCQNTQKGGQTGCGKCTFDGSRITCSAAAVGYFFKNGLVYACSDTKQGGVSGCTSCRYANSKVTCFSTKFIAEAESP